MTQPPWMMRVYSPAYIQWLVAWCRARPGSVWVSEERVWYVPCEFEEELRKECANRRANTVHMEICK